jgi:hypothetical protein
MKSDQNHTIVRKLGISFRALLKNNSLTLRSVSAVAAGLARGLRERGCSAGAADTLQLD